MVTVSRKHLMKRVERDLRPLYSSDPSVGGIVDRHPRQTSGWSGNTLGDLYLGAKINLMSEADQQAFAFAVRPMVKLPGLDWQLRSKAH